MPFRLFEAVFSCAVAIDQTIVGRTELTEFYSNITIGANEEPALGKTTTKEESALFRQPMEDTSN